MVDARVIALVLGIAGAVFGVSALLFDTGAFGAAAGAAALGAGVVALWSTPRRPTTVAEEEAASQDQPIGRDTVDAQDETDELTDVQPGPDVSDPQSAAAVQPAGNPSLDSTTGTEPSSLTDTDSQLFSEAYFLVALQSRLASARRHLRPVSVCLIEVTEGQADAVAGPAPAGRVADAIRQTVREADIACRMDDGTFAVILEDTPENGAVWTVERTRRNLVSRFGTHTMWAGVACYPAHAFSGDELVAQARAALHSAQEWNQDRIEVAAVDG